PLAARRRSARAGGAGGSRRGPVVPDGSPRGLRRPHHPGQAGTALPRSRLSRGFPPDDAGARLPGGRRARPRLSPPPRGQARPGRRAGQPEARLRPERAESADRQVDERIDVLVVGDDGWVDVWVDLRAEHTGTALAFHRGFWAALTLYHRSGTRYAVA